MTMKVYSVSPKRMKEALGITSNDMIDLDVSLRKSGYLRLDAGYNTGNQIHYVQMSDDWTDEMLTQALPQLALVRTAITIASAMGKLEQHSADQIINRFTTDNAATQELIATQVAFSLENSGKEYSQPIREVYNYPEDDLGKFAAWAMRIAPAITNQMLRRAADVTGLSIDVLMTYLPVDTQIGEDLAPDVMESWDKGLKATTAELYNWLRLNPAVENPRYTRYATMLGLDPNKAWQEVDSWMHNPTRT